MKLIPNKHQLQYLSAEDQAYWKGYFQGLVDAAVRAERRIAAPEPLSFGEIAAMPKGEQRDAEIKRLFQSKRAIAIAVDETGRTNYAA